MLLSGGLLDLSGLSCTCWRVDPAFVPLAKLGQDCRARLEIAFAGLRGKA